MPLVFTAPAIAAPAWSEYFREYFRERSAAPDIQRILDRGKLIVAALIESLSLVAQCRGELGQLARVFQTMARLAH